MLGRRPARSPVEVVERLLAVQAQDPSGARLAIRARSAGLSAADVDRALVDERSLVLTWLNRGTLHLVRREDYGWLHALTAPPVEATGWRRLAEEGVTPRAAERGVAVIERALTADGPLAGRVLRERLDVAGVPTAGQALAHLLMLASRRGLILRVPVGGRDQGYALVRDWIGEPEPVDRDAALAELARRYLRGHAPADDRDLARWAGIRLSDARAGLRAVPAPAATPRATPRKLPAPRLLGPFDPLLLGWRSRDELVRADAGVVTSNGIVRPVALVGGRVRGLWKLADGTLDLQPLEPLSEADAAALRVDAEDVLRYLGG